MEHFFKIKIGLLLIFFFTIFCKPDLCANSISRAKKVFAHYLPWYDADASYPGSWYRRGWCYEGDCSDLLNVGYTHAPRIGEYSFSDSDVIEYHILTAFMAGIDGFIINLDPANSYQKAITLDVLDELLTLKSAHIELADFSIIISYDSNATDTTIINSNLHIIYNDIYNNMTYEPLIFKDDLTNDQVLMTWSEANVAAYYTYANAIWGSGQILLIVRNATNFDNSDSNFQWVNNFSTLANQATNWGEPYFNDFEWIMARQCDFGLTNPANANTVMMGMAYPGFDDGNVPTSWNGGVHRWIFRNVAAGETMALTWDRQINYVVNGTGGYTNVENPWIQLITWNDWPEGTSIEPATDGTYGFTPLLTSKTKTDAWKGNNGYDSDCIEVPYLIYQAKKAGFTSAASSAMTQLFNNDCVAAKTALNAALPIDLAYFKVECEQEQLIFSWQTLEEIQIDYFEIEGSNNGMNWELLEKINPLNQANIYEYQMKLFEAPISLFRLKVLHLNGQVEYSKIIVANCSIKNIEISIYPNPIADCLKISILSTKTQTVFLNLKDVLGREILKKRFFLAQGHNQLTIKHLENYEGHIFLGLFDHFHQQIYSNIIFCN